MKEQHLLIVPCAASHISFLRLFWWTGRQWHFMEARIYEEDIFKVPTCSVSQPNAFMYVQNVSSLLIEMQHISAENFNIDK